MIKKLLSGVIGLLTIVSYGQSTCTDAAGFLVPDVPPQTLSSNGGFYEFYATTGCNYSFSHCMNGGSYTGDPYLTITDLSNVTLAANDDNCGLGSQLTWTSTVTGLVRIHLGVCCGGTGVCGSGPTRVLAYWSDCAACTNAAPVTVDPVSAQCASGSFTLNATSTDQVSWFSSPNTSTAPLFVGTPFVTPVITTTTTYYVAAYDAVNDCFGAPVAVTAVIDNPLTIAYNGNVTFCDNGEAVLMPFTPGGGTISGTGVSANMFDPSAAGPGSFWIYYDAGDACSSIDSVEVDVLTATIDPTIYACEGDTVPVNGTATGTVAWFSGQTSNALLDTGNVIDWVLNASTTLYYGELPPAFYVDTITVSNFAVSDHDGITSDDRGGIAITPDYLYVVGDGSTGRIDKDLAGPWTSLPLRDGIFSDLSTGQLYTLWNGAAAPGGTFIGSDYSLNSICMMDADLVINTAGAIPLSQTITLNNGSGDLGIFAGQGVVIIWTPQTNTFYQIETTSGTVTTLGTGAISGYNSENWAFWGIAETVAGDPCVTFRSNAGDQIIRYNITDMMTTTVANFPSGLSDMSSITVSPWNDRFYFHYEGSTATFGGSSETAGYTDAVLAYTGGSSGCRTAVELIISAPVPALGADTTICSNAPLVLNPGSGFGSYNWSTSVTTSTISVSTADSYSVEVTDSLGCSNSDTIVVSVNPVVEVNLGNDITLCDYQMVVLNAGGGYTDYSWNSGQSDQIVYIETDTLAIGANTFSVTVTDANGCFSTDAVDVIVLSCVGLDETSTSGILVYPNPVTDNLFINLNENAVAQIQIVDLTGKLIASLVPTSDFVTIDASQFSNGLYIVNVIGSENEIQQTIKISVVH